MPTGHTEFHEATALVLSKSIGCPYSRGICRGTRHAADKTIANIRDLLPVFGTDNLLFGSADARPMTAIEKILCAVEEINDPVVDRAMVAALPSADPHSIHQLTRSLLDRQHPEGTLGLILQYHLLPKHAQRAIVKQANSLFRPLRCAISRGHSEAPANAIRIITEAQCNRLAYLVSEQLRHGPQNLRDLAAVCLRQMAQRYHTDGDAADPGDASYLQAAVEQAVLLFTNHGHNAVLLALTTLLPRPMPRAWAALTDPSHPAHEPLRRLMGQATDQSVRQGLPALLAIPTLADAAIDGLRQSNQAGQLGDALASFHLLLHPAARQSLSQLKSPQTLWPSPQQIATMHPSQSRGLAAWLMALPFGRKARIAHLSRLILAPDTSTRLFALRRLLRLAHETNDRHIQDTIAAFCKDTHVMIARIALWHLIHSKYEAMASILAQLANSNHADLRQIASQHLAPLGFVRLWNQWQQLAPIQRVATGCAIVKIEPNFHHQLSNKILSHDQNTRLRALAMIYELNQGSFFETALVQLVEDQDKRIASAAVRALGSVAIGPRPLKSVQRALRDPDSRVRANAIEALIRMQATDENEQLARMAKSEQNRPRANAIGALLGQGHRSALAALVQMLADERAAHRCSALWIVRKMRRIELSRQVAELAISDPDDEVRSKAAQLVQDLIVQMTALPQDNQTAESPAA